jgi:hypothetical protein
MKFIQIIMLICISACALQSSASNLAISDIATVGILISSQTLTKEIL